MANPEHLEKLKSGVREWNEWRRLSLMVRPDLEGADLTSVEIGGADFHGARLNSADLSHCLAQEANFRGARMEGVKARGTHFKSCDFSGADLRGADLSEAILVYTVFNATKLTEANLSRACVGYTTFADTNLADVEGLETLFFDYPSTIGIDTLLLSGALPERFLRGCGLPEDVILYVSALVETPIEYYSTFISFSSRNEAFTRRLHDALQDQEIRTWYAPKDLRIGDRLRSRIEESIRVHDKLIVVLSANSTASDWVETEVEAALERERKEKRDIVFPIAIDDEGFDSQQAWAADVRRKRHIGDFRKWRNAGAFERAFDRLARDLRKSARKTAR